MANELTNRESLAEVIRWMNNRGWSPGTSTNYSFLHPEWSDIIVVSISGIDKSVFSSEDFMHIDLEGLPTESYSDYKPSAEALIHTSIYRNFPETKFILHTHSKAATMLSNIFAEEKFLNLSGYEVLKGLPNIATHDASIQIPIFPNDQDMPRFSEMLDSNVNLLIHHAFLIEKHGLYVWGDSLFEAKRHLDIYEFLLDIELTLNYIK